MNQPNIDQRLLSDRFPRSSAYRPDWVITSAMGSNTLWLTEWLASAMELNAGMRVLDLGCGRALSSIFLAREFDVQVWATDLWISASENIQRIRDAGEADQGRNLGYIRMVGRRRSDAALVDYCWPDTMRSFPQEYTAQPL